ncbi:putative integral membrane protein [Cryptosporidium felis]|nr:putative integral membrane protein [Cryptosporidium felis]
MVMRKREEVLVIYIKLVIQFVCFYCVTISIFNKEWISGRSHNSNISVTASLDNICIVNFPFASSEKLFEQATTRNKSELNDYIGLPNGVINSSYPHTQNKAKIYSYLKPVINSETDYKSIAHPRDEDLSNDSKSEILKEKKNRFKQKGKVNERVHLPLFEQVQYCADYKGNGFIKGWQIYPNYINFLILVMVAISVGMGLRLVSIKNKWITSELVVPSLDFIIFAANLVNLAQILHVLASLVEHLQKQGFEAYFSTNFLLYSFSIGGFFVILSLSIGITHYRYETHTRLKRLEERIENIQSFNSLIHLVSNGNRVGVN